MKRITVIIFLLLCLTANAQERFRLEDFSGGVNYTSPRGALAPNQMYQFINFVIKGRWLEVREGLTSWLRSTSFSDAGIDYLGIYQTQALWELIVSNGINIWIGNDSSDFETVLNPFDYAEGTCSLTASVYKLYGSSQEDVGWRSTWGYLPEDTLYAHIGDDSYKIAYFIEDTIAWLYNKSDSAISGASYYIGSGIGAIEGVINWGDKAYISSDRGLFYYDGNEVSTLDSAILPYRYRIDTVVNDTANDEIYIAFNDTSFGCGSCSTWDAGEFNNWWLDFTTDPKLIDTGKYADSTFYSLLRITKTEACTLIIDMKSQSDSTGDVDNIVIPLCVDEFASITMRDNEIYLSYTNNPFDSNYCLIATNDSTNGILLYWGADTTTTPGGWSSLFEYGEGVLSVYAKYYRWNDHHYNYGETKENIPIIGSLDIDTIGRWTVFPLFYTESGKYIDCALDDTCYYFLLDTVTIGTDRDSIWVTYNVNWRKINRSSSQSTGAYKYLERYKYRLFYIKSDPNVLYWSKKYYPDSINESNNINLETFDGDWITGLKTQGDFLIGYKNNSVLQIYPTQYNYANDPQASGFDFREVALGIGCIAPRTIVNVSGVHYFLSNKGLVAFDGSAFRVVSNPINDWLDDSLDYDNIGKACAVEYDDNVWLSIPVLPSTSDQNEVTFVYNLPTGAWARFDFGVGAFVINGRPNDTLDLFIGSPDSGFVFTYGGDADGGDSIEAIVQTDYLDFGVPHLYKISRELVIPYDMPAACNLGVSIYRDYSTTALWLDTLTHTSTYGQFRIPCKDTAYGRNLSLRLTFYNAADVKIPWLEWFIKAKGLAR